MRRLIARRNSRRRSWEGIRWPWARQALWPATRQALWTGAAATHLFYSARSPAMPPCFSAIAISHTRPSTLLVVGLVLRPRQATPLLFLGAALGQVQRQRPLMYRHFSTRRAPMAMAPRCCLVVLRRRCRRSPARRTTRLLCLAGLRSHRLQDRQMTPQHYLAGRCRRRHCSAGQGTTRLRFLAGRARCPRPSLGRRTTQRRCSEDLRRPPHRLQGRRTTPRRCLAGPHRWSRLFKGRSTTPPPFSAGRRRPSRPFQPPPLAHRRAIRAQVWRYFRRARPLCRALHSATAHRRTCPASLAGATVTIRSRRPPGPHNRARTHSSRPPRRPAIGLRSREPRRPPRRRRRRRMCPICSARRRAGTCLEHSLRRLRPRGIREQHTRLERAASPGLRPPRAPRLRRASRGRATSPRSGESG